MIRRALALSFALALTSGCVFVNETDIDGAHVADAGVPDADAGMDGQTPDADAGGDGGDACPPGGCVETSCTNGEDDDGDGVVDCADFDCTDFPGCCDEGAALLPAGWDGSLSLDWRTVPSGAPYPLVGEDDPDGGSGEAYLRAFEADMPSGLVHRSCQPLSLGARLEVTMSPLGSPGCTDASCDRFAALVLTAAQDALPGRRLLDDLAVTVQANGLVRVTQGGRTLAEQHVELAPDGRAHLALEVTPGVDDRDRPALFATVGVTDRRAGTGEMKLLSRHPFLLQRDLLSGVPGCDAVPGLQVAVEGQGDRVQVGPLAARSLECVNPSHFRVPAEQGATLSPEDLDLGAWADGGLGAPALASTCAEGTVACGSGDGSPGVRWDVLVEGTNVDPALERFTHVGWSLGHAASTQWDAALGWIADPAGAPKAGHDPPTCLDGAADGGVDACDGARSLRDPAVWPFTDPLGQIDPTDGLLVAYAREWEEAVQQGQRDRFALHVRAVPAAPEQAFDAAEGRRWTPADAGCDSLRHPEVLPASDAPQSDGWWLLYTCERAGEPPEVQAVGLSGLLNVRAEATPRTVLSAAALGDAAAGGVRAAEGLVASDPQAEALPPLYRVWFVARDASGRETIGLAQGRSPTFDTFPALAPYRGNPVLRVDDPVLGGPCGEGCALLGLDVVRRADDPGASDAPWTLRFLVARRVNGTDHELVPVEQLWRPPR
ncbi:MAG: hypothetical protein ACODAU_00020 [Myxococcota bacterium]